MKKKIIIWCLLSFFVIGNTFSSEGETPTYSCSYSGKFNTCIENQWQARTIKDFICLERDIKNKKWENIKRPFWVILSQIILDEKFKEIQNEILEWMKKLSESKGENFCATATESGLKAIDDIYKNFPEEWYYWGKFKTLCEWWEILTEIAKCTWGVPNIEAKNFLWNGGVSSNKCMQDAAVFLSISRQVAKDTLKLNKIQCRKDSRKKHFQEERTKYDAIVDTMRVIIGHLERMLNGWVTKTPNPK